jgi:hypothetical protein
LHLANALVHSFKVLHDPIEGFAKPGLKGGLQLLVNGLPHLVELGRILMPNRIKAALNGGPQRFLTFLKFFAQPGNRRSHIFEPFLLHPARLTQRVGHTRTEPLKVAAEFVAKALGGLGLLLGAVIKLRFDEGPQSLAAGVGFRSHLRQRTLIVCGYSGRDQSIMEALHAACAEKGVGALYWCGYGDGDVPEPVARLIAHARAHGRQAFYVSALGFDDLMTRLALHCLDGERREAARKDIAALAPDDLLARAPFQLAEHRTNTLIKSNAFEIDCPAEVLSFDLKAWPSEKVWSWVREQTGARPVVAVPFKGKILALGTIDEIKDCFGDNINGLVERTPVSPDELRYEDGAIVGLMREALVRSMAKAAAVETDGHSELWLHEPLKKVRQDNVLCHAHESVIVFLRRVGGTQYVVLKPSIKVLDQNRAEVPYEIAGPVKLGILGYQHNKPFNTAMNKWRGLLFPKDKACSFAFPTGAGSSFTFRVRRSPVFAQIGLPHGGRSANIAQSLRPLIKYKGLELAEPTLVFCDRRGTGTNTDTHPVRGLAASRPFDFPLTLKGLAPSLRVGVICPRSEAPLMRGYLQKANQGHRPADTERDYLVDYPGFQQAYGLPIEIPEPGAPGWAFCAEPSGSGGHTGAVSVAQQITGALEALRSSYAPHVVLVFFPYRWDHLRGYRDENERFDVHDFVKAYAVQRGVATQFLTEDTLSDRQQCRVWWWLSLALYDADSLGTRRPRGRRGLCRARLQHRPECREGQPRRPRMQPHLQCAWRRPSVSTEQG